MKMKINYKKGSNTGTIADNIYAGKTEYCACTATASRWFKTLNGAKRWMEKQGYAQA